MHEGGGKEREHINLVLPLGLIGDWPQDQNLSELQLSTPGKNQTDLLLIGFA